MQISNTINPATIQSTTKVAETPVAVPAPTPSPVDGDTSDDFALVQLAARAVNQTAPDFDVARVAEIKTALLRGEIRFDADKLASLIFSIHGGKR